MKYVKRMIAAMLAIVMCISLLPNLPASAAEDKVHYYGKKTYGGVTVGKFSVNGETAFCMEHKKSTPPTGTKLSTSIYENKNVRKVLYYGWKGQEQWSGFKNEAQGYVCTSLALSYYYSGPKSVITLGGPTDAKVGLSKFLNYIKNKTVPTKEIDFSVDTANSYISGSVQRTKNITFKADERNKVTVTLPKNVTLKKVSGKVSGSTGKVQIYGRTTFYLTAPLSMSGTFSTGKIKGSLHEFQSILCKTKSTKTQDLVKSGVKDPTETTSLKVNWTAAPGKVIIKKMLKPTVGVEVVAGAGVGFTAINTTTKKKIVFKTNAKGIAEVTLTVGDWTVYETDPPEGYTPANPFKVHIAGNTVNKTLVNKEINSIQIFKKDAESGKPLANATFKIRAKESGEDVTWTKEDGSTFVEFKTGDNGIAILPYATSVKNEGEEPLNYLQPGEYELVETESPDGYFLAKPLPFTIKEGWKGEPISLTVSDQPTEINISKTDITGEKELPGAELSVTDEDGQEIDHWISEEEPHKITGLVVGKKYTLTEVLAPDKYCKANSIEFTVKNDSDGQKVVMKDKQVAISKVDVTGEKELPGAELSVTDEEGQEIDHWTSGEEPHVISGLVVGKSYILSEKVAPSEYCKANDIKFTVTDDGQNQKVVMKDKQVHILKLDASTKKPLAGAELAILDEKGQEIDRWISEKNAHKVDGLVVGEKYTLTEKTAPDGYVKANDIEFTVKDDGETQVVEMKDEMTRIEVKKLASDTKKPLDGCKLQILAAEDIRSDAKLGEDDQKVLYKKGTVVETFTSGKENWKKEKFPAGKYILHEVSCPKKYKLAKDVKFTVKRTAKLQTVVMVDELQVGSIDTNIPHSNRSDKNTSVKTGDLANPLLYIILLAGSAALVFWVKKKQGKEDVDEKSKENE